MPVKMTSSFSGFSFGTMPLAGDLLDGMGDTCDEGIMGTSYTESARE
jgi:hypothetical protein